MLSSSLDRLLNLSKRISPLKLFAYDCVTLYLFRVPGRTAGDVLNDIGTMLADLTDELDAMLQLERNIYKTIVF